MKKILFAFIALLPFGGQAQNSAPAKPQAKPMVLTGATIHLGNGVVVENGLIAFDNGLITAVGPSSTAVNRTGADVIDLAGKHIFPGVIAMGSTIGIQEIASVRATLDFEEIGEINPHVRSLVAYSTDSEVTPTLRASGVLMAQSVPQGGLVSGSSSVFNTDGWNWEDAVLRKDDGIWLSWPSYLARSFNYDDFSFTTKKNEKRAETISLLESTFADAKAYSEIDKPEMTNIRLDAMKNLFTGKQNLYVRANYAKDIIDAVKFAKKMGVSKVVIVGGNEAAKVAPFLKENNVPVVLGALHSLPSRPDDDVYAVYELPAKLHKAGVKVALSYDDEWWRVRNLPYQAGTAAAFGDVSKEEALMFLTQNPAQIMGVDAMVGTLEKGKHATLIVTNGNMMDMRGNVVEHAFIKGAKVNLDNKQSRLYEKYKEKYGQE
ncbi:amidohydrolase family protein [Persicitalea jodogahamensis]|uniref:Imidazolonepropionase n=1 Tax=Persicitalea jodogahamensis TaxID=402147 RepID=A0A8J3D573_9BACT|nr:amidohydrolase family protein [Persicitalea jodogahamensis]GHB76863.1 imidazolonepropionase [Persicitalea jodogahamensis]